MRNIQVPSKQIAEFCKHNHIKYLALFGSVINEDFSETSDIDVLVKFEHGHTPGWEFVTLQDELSNIFGKEVDLHTPNSLSPHFRDEVLSQATVLYES